MSRVGWWGGVGKRLSGRGSNKHKSLGVEENTVCFPWEVVQCAGSVEVRRTVMTKGLQCRMTVTFHISVFKIYTICDVGFGLVGGDFIWPLFLMKARK